MKRTKDGTWRTEKLELKTGVNVLNWRAFQPPMSAARMRKPVLIQSIDISGLFSCHVMLRRYCLASLAVVGCNDK